MTIAVKKLGSGTGAIEDNGVDGGVFFQERLDVVALQSAFGEGGVGTVIANTAGYAIPEGNSMAGDELFPAF